MGRRKKEGINVFSQSFIDVFANTLGGLAFILIIVILLMGNIDLFKPFINTERLPNAYEGVPWEVWLSAREGLGNYNWQIVEGELPPGLKMIDSLRGHIAGIPELNNIQRDGEYKFAVQVDAGKIDSAYLDKHEYIIQLKESPYGELKILTKDTLPIAIKGEDYPIVFAATGGKPPYIWSIISNGIKGTKLNNFGELSGIVDNREGLYEFEVQIVDNFRTSLRKIFVVEVVDNPEPCIHEPLVILTDTLPDALKGKNYKISFSGQGGYHPYKWEINHSIDNIQHSSNGDISGIPEKIGNYNLSVMITDAKGEKSAIKNFKLNVLLPPREDIAPLEILSDSKLPEISEKVLFKWALSAIGGIEPYTWEIIKEQNDSINIEISNNGILSGEFASKGNYSFTINLIDNEGQKLSKLFSVNVLPEFKDLIIETDNLPFAVKGFNYNCELAASGGYPPYLWSTYTDLPEGIVLSNGTLIGTTQATWSGIINVICSDQMGTIITKELLFEVLESGQGSISRKLEINPTQLPTLMIGQTIEIPISVTGGVLPYRWENVGTITSGIGFQNGVFTGKVSSSSNDSLTVIVTDSSGQEASSEFVINSKRKIDYWWKLVTFALLGIALLMLSWSIIVLRKLIKAKKYPLEIASKVIPNARCSFDYSCHLSAVGGVPPYIWSVEEGEMPEGLSLREDGLISGVPLKGIKLNKVKEFDFTVKVTDSIGNSANQKL